MNSSSIESTIPTTSYKSALQSLLRIIHYRRRQIAALCVFSLVLTAAIHVAIPPQHKAVGLIFFMPNGVASKDAIARILIQTLQSDSARGGLLHRLQTSHDFAAKFAASGRNFVSVTVMSGDPDTARMAAEYYLRNSGSIVEPVVSNMLQGKKSIFEHRRASNEQNIESVEESLYGLLRADPGLLPYARQYSAVYLGMGKSGEVGVEAHNQPAKEFDGTAAEGRLVEQLTPRRTHFDHAAAKPINPDSDLKVRRLTRELASLEHAKFLLLSEQLQDASHSQVYAAPAGAVTLTKNVGYFSSLLMKLLLVGCLTILVGIFVALILHAFTLAQD